jgi:NADH-quinone oxidoreductase subunit D
MYGYRDREYALDLLEMVTGQRMHTNYCRVGGLKEDLPKGFYERIPSVLDYYRTRVDQWLDFLIGNDVFIERTKDIGILPGDVALDYGVSGPNLRASGVLSDARREEGYLGYEGLEFETPVGEVGDCFDRYVQRVREMWESCNIVEQVLEGLPSGPINNPKVKRVFKVPAGEVYIRADGPRGETGYYLISTGGREPYRLKIRTGSFSNVSVLPYLLKGVLVPDVVAILGSLDFVVGDIDR